MKINAAISKLALAAAISLAAANASALEWIHGQDVHLACDTNMVKPVVRSAVRMLESDIMKVLGSHLLVPNDVGQLKKIAKRGEKGKICAIIVREDAVALGHKKEAFRLSVKGNSLFVTGSDAHGMAYGLLEVSRLIGVSPWEWWADSAPQSLKALRLGNDYVNEQSPSVEFRGIFINDEDWGLMPWASKTYEPTDVRGQIGPKTNARIFELLLRLRANTYWPAMHECTRPFFLTEGNREVAQQYGIYIGGSHCEPMASSTAGEWPARGKGEYDYVNNSENVYRFWEDRVKDVANQPILYTLGMRGVHDGAMNGAKTVDEQKAVLERAIKDQRHLLSQYIKGDIADIPQVFIPYKEVLDVYNAGLKVPDDVCLVWCDDNYGYVRHFPTAEERARKGGHGIYYHVSYWGRPHDYLWLGTLSPALLFQQMSTAWHHGIQRFWILNVGDIKPAEYQIELFMDMAWNMNNIYPDGSSETQLVPNNAWLNRHVHDFYAREFGSQMADKLAGIMLEHYRLAFIRKPEFLGNTRCEEWDRKYYIIKDLSWSERAIRQRLGEYKHLADEVEAASEIIAADKKDAFFQLVKYPVQAAAQMNNKLLMAQLARHGKAAWEASDAAFDSIAHLTDIYNKGYDNDGKWMRMMDFKPRKQPVFERVEHTKDNSLMIEDRRVIAQFNATECYVGNPVPWEGLGYEGKAAGINKGESLSFRFTMVDLSADSVEVEVNLLPSHPIEGGLLRFSVSLDGGKEIVNEYQTQGRSEEWKVNVLGNHATRVLTLPMPRTANHTLTVKAIDEGVVLDQICACRCRATAYGNK